MTIQAQADKDHAIIEVFPDEAATQKPDQEKIVGLIVKVDSMSPAIQDRSLVAIDLENREKIQRNKIYAVETPDAGATIKQVIKSDDQLMLFADNPGEIGFPICISTKVLSYNLVCGRVVWTWNKL